MIRACLISVASLAFSGCGTLHFYTQGAIGQAEILYKSRPNQRVLDSPETSSSLKSQIILAQSLCDFATRELALPGNSAYRKYTDLGRKHVVFVLHASPEFSLEPKTWYYPLVGDLDYRGYFSEENTIRYAEKLRAQGLDIYHGGTDAYSTLGFFHDPLLNTFIDYPEINLAEIIFHELTHRRVFVKGDTTFNESLANTVAEEGVRRWLTSQNRKADLQDYEERLIRRREFYAEIELARKHLTKLYASSLQEDQMRLRKRQIFAELKSRAKALQKRWGGKQLAEWLRQDLTNAHLIALTVYNQDIGKFKKLLTESNGDFEAFFKKVEALK